MGAESCFLGIAGVSNCPVYRVERCRTTTLRSSGQAGPALRICRDTGGGLSVSGGVSFLYRLEMGSEFCFLRVTGVFDRFGVPIRNATASDLLGRLGGFGVKR